MRRRLASLRIAATLAAGFIALRVLYRVVFGGAGGNGILIVDLPRVPLAGPFAHITLFGDVTTGGIAAAAVSALPFAGLILAFGILGVLVDLRALLARGAIRGPVRTVSRILVVAWATFPALLESVTRVRIARELRGERSAASLIVPVLEQTIERAVALGASMEVRGFAATRQVVPDRARPATMRDAALGFDGIPVLAGVDLDFAPGTVTLVTGATGSGKSTLLHALSGLFQHVADGRQVGGVLVGGADRDAVPPRDTASFVGVVSQSPRLSFVAATVAEELGFARAMLGEEPRSVAHAVAEVAGRLGIDHLLDKEVVSLSAGEACLVAIGAAVGRRPVLLLVDEPLADLDDEARRRVVRALDDLAHRNGVCVVVAEHAVQDWDRPVDAVIELRDGAAHRAASLHRDHRIVPADRTLPGAEVARIRGLTVTHGAVAAVRDVDLDLAAGEIVAVRGPNGAGKSSLLLAIARPPVRGSVLVRGVDVRTLGRRARRRVVALVPEAFDDLLFATSVEQECRRAGRSTAATFTALLGLTPVASQAILRRHPRDLSAGERLCLVIAIQLSARPAVLLIDEPTRGLDATAQQIVGTALAAVAASGAAVVVATHDRVFAERFATRTVVMTAGRIVAAEPVVTP